MEKFTINIREILEMQVTVEAESLMDAIMRVKQAYQDGDYVLGADNFVDVDFTEV